ncbi:VWFA and cache domain-containing protein 1-like [Crassostrea virginica]|uniref:VWFA and cache domain-containing protein 1-like n=1 Tax=Crassostrea virginica TaxID=6565 RepID=A0A8B8DTR2_CRAVI|nr:VWFA and cache domain-containing protein 1-like [Crassostrea virginica]
MTVHTLAVYLFALIFQYVHNAHAQEISGEILANKLNQVADAVGWSFIQNEYNKLKYKDTKTDGEKLVREISDKISGRMKDVATGLKELKTAVELDQLSSAVVPQDCCMDGVYTENVRFRANVSLEMLCYSRPSYVTSADSKYPGAGILTALKDNLDKKIIQFQYIGTKSGLYINYPATKLTDCETYDPRFRPFYVSSTASIPRDVVVVLEMSASMRGDKLFQAKHAALTVLETLSVQDMFGFVVFNNEAQTLGGCYGEQLVPVTQTTKMSLRDFLVSRDASGGADYAKALRRAFAYFKSARDGKNRDQILLFVSDGANDGGDPLEVIRDENQQLNNRVVIHTYGIGTGLSSSERNLLEKMAEQPLNNNSYGYIKRGKFEFLSNLASTSLREAMGTFYDDSSTPITDIPTYTMPYKDFFTNESIITGCLPIAYKGGFEGVVCADVLLSELVAEILYLKQGEFSYAFVMDGEERTLVHPLIPDPRDVIAKEQDIINIYNFETSGDVNMVIQSMKKGHESHKVLDTTIMKTRGQKYLDGDSLLNIKASYHWTPIVAPGSNLSVCLVMEVNNTESTITNLLHSSPGDFLYHRWDLDKWPVPFCRHFSRFATQAKSSVKLTPDAFIEPYLYTGVKETELKVQQYKDYLSGERSTNPGLKPSAIESIRLTYPIEEFWRTKSRDDAPYVVWRYVMTEDGVERMYPAVRVKDDYDHKLRPWYHRTVAQKLLNVVSAPYEDSWGSGKVITLSKAILNRNGKKIEAVIGTDFSIYYFNQMLQDNYLICANKTRYTCIVIDNSGFLVIHPYYIETTTPITTQVHITYKEGRISRSLMSNGIMYRQPCRDTENKKEQFTYRVKLPQTHLNGFVDKAEGYMYEIRPVTGSNIFLILKKREAFIVDQPCCSEESSTSPSSLRCGTEQCTCLCYKDILFNECRNEYNSTDGVIPCNPLLPTLKTVSAPEEGKTKDLSTCFPTDCACRKSESECFRTSGCSWCKSDVRGNLVDGFCDLKEICPSQQCLKDECKAKCCGSECDTPPSPPILLYVGSSVGGTVALIIVILIVVFICRSRRVQRDDTYLDPTTDKEYFKNASKEKLDYNQSTNYYLSELSLAGEE